MKMKLYYVARIFEEQSDEGIEEKAFYISGPHSTYDIAYDSKQKYLDSVYTTAEIKIVTNEIIVN